MSRPELIKESLYRQFNNGSFSQGGRLYGAWWIECPKALRPNITISGKPTVELDYSGCGVRMLYHQRGIDYAGEPYVLDPIVAHLRAHGHDEDSYREAIKKLTSALINDPNNGKPERIELPDGLSFKPWFTRLQIRKMIEEKHAPIADAFGTGAGLRLMRRESDLALAIITDLREKEIVALPIHDGFITDVSSKDELNKVMIGKYKDLFVFNPVIKLNINK